MADLISTPADAAALVRDGVALLDSVASVDIASTAINVAAEGGFVMSTRQTATLTIVTHDGAHLLVTVEMVKADNDVTGDAAAIATKAGWLIEDPSGGEFDEGVFSAWASPGSYTMGDWQRDLTPPLGAVYQWRCGSVGEGGDLFLSTGGPMGDGTQYRVATINAEG